MALANLADHSVHGQAVTKLALAALAQDAHRPRNVRPRLVAGLLVLCHEPADIRGIKLWSVLGNELHHVLPRVRARLTFTGHRNDGSGVRAGGGASTIACERHCRFGAAPFV